MVYFLSGAPSRVEPGFVIDWAELRSTTTGPIGTGVYGDTSTYPNDSVSTIVVVCVCEGLVRASQRGHRLDNHGLMFESSGVIEVASR